MSFEQSTDGQTIGQIAETLKLAAIFRDTGKLYTFTPYPKQREFFNLLKPERMLRAGNQEGKTYAAAYEVAVHMTGIYPPWWEGYRFHKPIRVWIAGVTAPLVRDAPQSLLLGDAAKGDEALGTGFVPKELIDGKPTASRSATNAVDTFKVKHVSGGISTATFKSYEQGREKFQSEPVDLLWLDEEPDEDIYSECLTRTTATNGIILLTYTPLKGMTPLTRRFMKEKPPTTGEVHMTIYDALHIKPEDRDAKIKAWPEHEREARAMGMPFLGSNAVFEEVTKKMIEVPLRVIDGVVHHKELGPLNTSHWVKLWGMDFGIGHPWAAVLLAWDREYDVIYVLDAVKQKGGIPKTHAPEIKRRAARVPIAWPHDGQQRDKGSGEQLAKIYKKEGLNMLAEHATFPDGGYSFEAGLMEMLVRMRSERFKVADHLVEWWDEFHSYYREKGLVVKEYDDIMSATRVGVMQIRSAKAVALGDAKPEAKRVGPAMCRDVDFDLS
jgi:phage terminase large subunit-like protein